MEVVVDDEGGEGKSGQPRQAPAPTTRLSLIMPLSGAAPDKLSKIFDPIFLHFAKEENVIICASL